MNFYLIWHCASLSRGCSSNHMGEFFVVLLWHADTCGVIVSLYLLSTNHISLWYLLELWSNLSLDMYPLVQVYYITEYLWFMTVFNRVQSSCIKLPAWHKLPLEFVLSHTIWVFYFIVDYFMVLIRQILNQNQADSTIPSNLMCASPRNHSI